MMSKSDIFSHAIQERVKVRFYYGLKEYILDPYFIFYEEDGTKALYGKSNRRDEPMKFDFEKIANIRVLKLERYIPEIPTSPFLN